MMSYYEIEVKDGKPCSALLLVPSDLADQLDNDDLIHVLKPCFAYLFKMSGALTSRHMDIEYEVINDIADLNLPDIYEGMTVVRAHTAPRSRKYLFLVRRN